MFILVGLIGTSVGSAGMAGRATMPASAPATAPSRETLARWVAELGNADAAVREHARWELLGMSRAELLALPGTLSKQAPLNASQRALLHEVVVHVFLATEPYEEDASKGFLGVQLGVRNVAAVHVVLPDSKPAAGDDQVPLGKVDSLIDPNEESPDTGIIVSERMPGFCGYRAFENGDVILAARDGEVSPIRSVERLRDLVQAHHAGDPMRFSVLRRGKIIEVEVRVNGLPAVAAPAVAAPGTIEVFLNGRARAAQAFWESHFAAVVGRHAA